MQVHAASLSEQELRQTVVEMNRRINDLEDRLNYVASTDALTGLKNRQAGIEIASRVLATGRSGLFVLFDCDKFKTINDEISHAVGDDVLIETANVLKRVFADDICFRLGGDEFAVCILEDRLIRTADGEIDIDATFKDLRDGLAAIQIPEIDFQVSMSGGAVYFNKPCDFHDIYRQSDSVLQESKRHRHGTIRVRS